MNGKNYVNIWIKWKPFENFFSLNHRLIFICIETFDSFSYVLRLDSFYGLKDVLSMNQLNTISNIIYVWILFEVFINIWFLETLFSKTFYRLKKSWKNQFLKEIQFIIDSNVCSMNCKIQRICKLDFFSHSSLPIPQTWEEHIILRKEWQMLLERLLNVKTNS